MITYLLPTHDRPQRLQKTLAAIQSLGVAAHEPIGGAEIIVIDNASSPPGQNPIASPSTLEPGLPIRILRLDQNLGAAARNIGAEQATGEWIVMLDDDSYPLDSHHIEVLLNAEDDVAAIGADIFLSDGTREAGGLPEVFTGCGVAIRRKAFLQAGGYDPDFDYYAEEYDLCAKLILNGWRIVHDLRFRIRHEKIAAGRDMDRILHRLVRNNGWVMQRYAPVEKREKELAEIVSRYARIAVKENAACGFARGMDELTRTIDRQAQRIMTQSLFDRFTGLAAAREHLCYPVSDVAIVDEGKNAGVIRQALTEAGAKIVAGERNADAVVMGTLSPGPMLDAAARRRAQGQRVILPWTPRGANLIDAAEACCSR